MELTTGGRITLRLVSRTEETVSYEGELVMAEARFPATLIAGITDGAVQIRVEGEPPGWLVEIARTTLRSAWRATKTGSPWPRRVNRWRAAKDTGED